jgi:hypothetical protein
MSIVTTTPTATTWGVVTTFSTRWREGVGIMRSDVILDNAVMNAGPEDIYKTCMQSQIFT